MTNQESRLLNPALSIETAERLSPLILAQVGDAVYGLMVRSRLCCEGVSRANTLHRKSVEIVNAKEQNRAARKLEVLLDPVERAIYLRGRNVKLQHTPKAASQVEYHYATALEAVCGFLWLTGQHSRLEELLGTIYPDQMEGGEQE